MRASVSSADTEVEDLRNSFIGVKNTSGLEITVYRPCCIGMHQSVTDAAEHIKYIGPRRTLRHPFYIVIESLAVLGFKNGKKCATVPIVKINFQYIFVARGANFIYSFGY